MLPIGIPLKILKSYNATKAKFNKSKTIFIVNNLTNFMLVEDEDNTYQFCIVEIGVIKGNKVEVKPCIVVTKNYSKLLNLNSYKKIESLNFYNYKKDEIGLNIIKDVSENNFLDHSHYSLFLKCYKFNVQIPKIKNYFLNNYYKDKYTKIIDNISSTPIIELASINEVDNINLYTDTDLILNTLHKYSIQFQLKLLELKTKNIEIDYTILKYTHNLIIQENIKSQINLIKSVFTSILNNYGNLISINFNNPIKTKFNLNNIDIMYIYLFNFIHYYNFNNKIIIIKELFEFFMSTPLPSNTIHSTIKFILLLNSDLYNKVLKISKLHIHEVIHRISRQDLRSIEMIKDTLMYCQLIHS